MITQALFVDLPNFYSHLLTSGIEEPRLLRDYFLYWLDFDRLAEKLTDEFCPVWIFYSGRRFGPRENRIQDHYLDTYIERINSIRGVTARDVNIPGSQRETVTYECEHCKRKGVAQWESEKGIDASLTVHLFDTIETWDVAYLLSSDADFVPVVASLRRRGKIIVGVGFFDTSSALVRECYDYVDLTKIFLRQDAIAYEIFRTGGLVEKWLNDEVQSLPGDISEIELSIEWQPVPPGRHTISENRLLTMTDLSPHSPHYVIYFGAQGPIEISSRHQLIEEFQTKFPDYVRKVDQRDQEYVLTISPLAWIGVERRLPMLASLIPDSQVLQGRTGGQICKKKYRHNPDKNKFESTTD